MSAPSDTYHAPKARDNWTIAFLQNVFQGKLQFSKPLGLSFQNKIPLILSHKPESTFKDQMSHHSIYKKGSQE